MEAHTIAVLVELGAQTRPVADQCLVCGLDLVLSRHCIDAGYHQSRIGETFDEFFGDRRIASCEHQFFRSHATLGVAPFLALRRLFVEVRQPHENIPHALLVRVIERAVHLVRRVRNRLLHTSQRPVLIRL